MSTTKSETIEHIALFKVKEDADQSKINSWVNGINDLNSLDQVLYLSVGPIFRNQSSSSSFNKFTHLLHSRYKTKDDLSTYSVHPNHLRVVKELGLPILEDIMAVDWVADLDEPMVILKPGSAMRVKFFKLKKEEGQVLGLLHGENKDQLIEQSSSGENFSPARAKGFSIASIAVFPGLNELDEFYLNEEEKVKPQKEKVQDLVDDIIVVDYVIPPLQLLSAKL